MKYANGALELLQRAALLGDDAPVIPPGGIGTGALTVIKTLRPENHVGLRKVSFSLAQHGLDLTIVLTIHKIVMSCALLEPDELSYRLVLGKYG